jgi:hypothetical protein
MARLALSVLTLALLIVQSADAGPWPRKHRSGYLQIGFSTIGYDRIYNADAVKQPIDADVRDNVVQLYADFGLSDLLTVTAMVPYKFIKATPTQPSATSQGSSTATNAGIGDIDVWVRYNLLQSGGTVLSGEVLFGLPTGDDRDPNGLILGDGEFNIMPRLLFGRSFYPAPVYLTADIGYNFRGTGFSDDVQFNAEVGYGFFSGRLYLMMLVSGQISTKTETTKDTPAAALGLDNNNREFIAFVPKALYKFGGGFGLVVSYATATHGRNVAAGAVFAANFFYEY